jgi:activating signal cointegrator complex subunit 1
MIDDVLHIFISHYFFLVITGPHRGGVLSARNQVELIAESSRQKCPFTHFLSFPLYFDELATKVGEFKDSVLQQFAQVGIEKASI